MAKHGFGIMNTAPKPNEQYVTYEPEKYGCISVCDDYIEPLLEKTSAIDCYWHSINHPEKGLAYCGITLIPPSSLRKFMEISEDATGTEELKKLLSKAEAENKFVIHFGI